MVESKRSEYYPTYPPGWLREQIKRSIDSLNRLPEDMRKALSQSVKSKNS